MLSGTTIPTLVDEAKVLLKNAELMREALEQMLLARKSMGLEVNNDDLQISLKANADIERMRARVQEMIDHEAVLAKQREELANLQNEVTELIADKPQKTQDLEIKIIITGSNIVLFPNQTSSPSLPSDAGTKTILKP